MWAIVDVPIVSRDYALVICGFLFTGLSTICVCLRIFARTFLVYTIGLDDLIVIIASLGSIAFFTSTVCQIKYGLGDAVRLQALHKFLQSVLATVISYNFTQITVKISIVVQYRRVLTSRSAERLLNCLLAWLSFYGLFCVAVSTVTCWPITKYWDDSIPGGCINRSTLHYILASINIVNDVLVLVAPWPSLNTLQLEKKARIALAGMFGCGVLVCIIAIVRLHSLYVNNSAPIDEQPVKGVDIALWSGLEINIAIMCASASTLRLLFMRMFPSFASTVAKSRISRKSDARRSNLQPVGNHNGHEFRNTNDQPSKAMHQGGRLVEMETLPSYLEDDSDQSLITYQRPPSERSVVSEVEQT